LNFATRPSALARWQTRWVMNALQQAWPGLDCQETVIETQGDRVLDRPLPEIGGKGLFTQELERELLEGRLDAAVHSLKDLPVEAPTGLVLAAIPARADARDVLISARGYTLESLPEGAVVGTSSLRRAAQLLARRPDLQTRSLRGNVDTRLRKAQGEEYDAIVLAAAGLERLGLLHHVTEWLSLDQMLPAPGQGALAVQARHEDDRTLELLARLDHPATRKATSAERAFLNGLGGGCSLPVAAYASVEGTTISLAGLVASPDGRGVLRVRGQGEDPHALGEELANHAVRQGARELLSGTGQPLTPASHK
jgi:hydroxymethylbilane synthase